jgi:hypothetical protein
MKKLLLTLILALGALNAYADIEGAPFMPESDKRFDAIEQGNHYPQGKYPAGATDGHYAKQLAQASYNFSVVGGAAGLYDLKVGLPKNAIIEKSWVDFVTQVFGTSDKIGFECGTAQNIFNPRSPDTFASGALKDGTQDWTAANMSTISAACNIKARVQGTVLSGLATVYVEYVVHQ